MISASRAGVSRNPARRARRSAVHSGIVHSGNEAHRFDKGFPRAALACQDLSPGSGQAVETPSSLPGLLDPPALQPAAFLESIEERIERRDMELECSVRTLLDQFADLVAVPGTRFEDRQDDQLGRP